MFTLNYLHKIHIEDVPLEWMTRLEFFSSDLEQFPLMYVHLLVNDKLTDTTKDVPEKVQRIFGFALSAKWSQLKSNKLCDVEIDFVCNVKQNLNSHWDKRIHEELSHRIGLADKVEFDDLALICKNSPQSLPLQVASVILTRLNFLIEPMS